jgi:hypothetical protein
MANGNQGVFELGLLDVRNRPARDSNVDVTILRASDNQALVRKKKLSFPPNKSFALPAFPQASNLFCDIAPSRFRIRKSAFFTLTDGETIRRNLTVLRLPDQWHARFDRWNDLTDHFGDLKAALDASNDLKVKGQSGSLGRFVENAYDDVDDDKTSEAKACLLNLYVKLSTMTAPTTKRNWFSFVERILEIDRERFIAIVEDEMGDVVRTIKDDITKFEDYKHTPAQNHHGNMPAGYTVAKSKMFSIKSAEDKGNIQLTMAPATDASGKTVLLLDTDIDENGKLLHHILDLFKHKVTGGTHPFDIHEYLALALPDVPLGYSLV